MRRAKWTGRGHVMAKKPYKPNRKRKPLPYQPSNGTACDIFMGDYCFQCKKLGSAPYGVNNPCQPEPCPILGGMFAHSAGDAEYPAELIYKDGQPHCTAFVHEDEEEKPERCPDTLDMFGEVAK